MVPTIFQCSLYYVKQRSFCLTRETAQVKLDILQIYINELLLHWNLPYLTRQRAKIFYFTYISISKNKVYCVIIRIPPRAHYLLKLPVCLAFTIVCQSAGTSKNSLQYHHYFRYFIQFLTIFSFLFSAFNKNLALPVSHSGKLNAFFIMIVKIQGLEESRIWRVQI